MEKAPVLYRYATIGFCLDLTDPKATSVPVAVMGSGETNDQGFVFLIATGEPSAASDPFSRDMLSRVPRLLREEMSKSLKKVGPAGWLDAFSQHLNQSLHVIRRGEEKVDAPIGDFSGLIDATIRLFSQRLGGFGQIRQPVSSGGWTKTRIPGAFMLEPVPAGHSGR